MSYSIYIGRLVSDPEDGAYTVVEETSVYAPRFDNDDMTGQSNGRHPGYGQWSEFCKIAGLAALFYGDRGFLKPHPGVRPLFRGQLGTVSAALQEWKRKFPGRTPGFAEGQDPILARLIWLEWWMNYALDKYEYPAMANS